jgi:TonB family protein
MSMQRVFDRARRLRIEWLILASLGCAGTESHEGGAGRSGSVPTASEVVNEDPKLIRMLPPVHPRAPHAPGISGIVGLDLLVGADGKVADSRIVQSVDPALDAAAAAAFREAVFRPATRAGQPVAAWLRLVEVEFKPYQAPIVLDFRPQFDVAPQLISIHHVVYPEDARERKSQGTVFVRVLVGENGRAIDTRIIRSVDPSLDSAAIAAAETAVFKPGMSQGKPVAVRMVIPIEFLLH